jgi:hypothetical protein
MSFRVAGKGVVVNYPRNCSTNLWIMSYDNVKT